MEWLNFSQGLQLQHEANGGKKRVGHRGLPVDGYDRLCGTAYQYQGQTNRVSKKTMPELREQTRAISSYLKKVLGEGHLVEMWGCRWQQIKCQQPEIRKFLRTRFGSPLDRKSTLTKTEILEAVQNDTLFGVVECDIHIPDELNPILLK